MDGTAGAAWRAIHHDLRAQIIDGRLTPGSALPSQACLCSRYQAPRHSVRRAIKALTDEQLVVTWQGKGAYVNVNRVAYRISDRTRFGDNVRNTGRRAETRMLGSKRQVPPPPIARLLGLTTREIVVVGQLLRLVDDMPFILGRHYYDARRFPSILAEIERTASVTKALEGIGITDYRREETLVETRMPTAFEAMVLAIAPTQPVLVVTGRNVDRDGRPLEVSQAVSRGDRIQLVI